jgi:hypothetical protein
MQSNCLNWNRSLRTLATFLMLATGACTPRAAPPRAETDLLPAKIDPPRAETDLRPAKIDPPRAETDPPKSPPDPIVTAWKEAGAEVGWLRVKTTGFLEFVPEKENKPGDLRAFRFAGWIEGRLTKLPDLTPAFGLDLSSTRLTDAGLKELAGLKSLQTLNLYATQVTDGGLKELAGLQNLQTLNLVATQVTDGGARIERCLTHSVQRHIRHFVT